MSKHDFRHPYTPYAIQLDFMQELYETLDAGKIGIFESPTGTGKSLSLICGSLAWLRDQSVVLPLTEAQGNEPAWILEQERENAIKAYEERQKEMNQKLSRIRQKERAARKGASQRNKRQKMAAKSESLAEEDFLVPDYDSDDSKISSVAKPVFSAEVEKLLEQMGHPSVAQEGDKEDDYPVARKIFFASRTHSQLSQFTHELQRVHLDGDDSVKHISLGSRKNLCIHPKISKLSPENLNEACLELQDGKTAQDQKCKFLPLTESLKQDFRDRALATIQDIEDLAQLGKELQVCPYYSSRLAIAPSEVVTMPYPLLLNKTARESLGVDLTDQVVIIDEAHNLVDAVASISSASISLAQLERVEVALNIYLTKFARRLNGKNKMYIQQLVMLSRGIAKALTSCKNKRDGQLTPADLLTGSSDTINISKISAYLTSSKLARKVDGYSQSIISDENKVIKTTPVLTLLQGFLECLANPSSEGRFFFETSQGSVVAKYMLLDPSHVFAAVVEEAHSVILAGGTMEPMDDYINLLFPSLRPRVSKFSCGHIIPKENLSAMVLSSGSAGQSFEFNFERRSNQAMLEDLGRSIRNLLGIIPDGVVVFFASYAYLEHVLDVWRRPELGIYEQISAKKPIFLEPRDGSVDEMLRNYTLSIESNKGGVLFAVVGGKMSEGINFSDRMGRAVIMVGLPFPNPNTAEWKAKLAYMSQAATDRHLLENTNSTRDEAQRVGKEAGREFYENACMRAVNQSIGRAIRHKGDYAAIILLDKRYGQERIQKKLPNWIKTGLRTEPLSFSQCVLQSASFFKKPAQSSIG
ncbi:ATP-dependent RNA helicase CHL1 [Protomyces lactucae-debilis]|uniref:ATP-dependent DNA helicase CHL1 n=1 Tax=Protomyces lactucae-debilis TaxID=2754530 RepID=A0A1Y2F693_PROLT|nr:ATP-dependent RNA helicase CHL1 [Protomyces lactucae-debilis]ORY79420.1 ATP-dependent RNA helicase CHL1 [Protomyces lactucae-debilis]